jgi:hypothetical protein
LKLMRIFESCFAESFFIVSTLIWILFRLYKWPEVSVQWPAELARFL